MASIEPPRTGVADMNGTQFYYEVAGAGHPLVLVHAGIADSRMWDDQFEAFAKHYQVIRYDMRGYGKTPTVAGDFSHRADLHALLKYLTIDHAYLLGCSLGGTTVIDFALEHPEMADALILVTTSPSGLEFSGAPPPQWEELMAAFKREDFERASELEVRIWVDGPHRQPSQVAAAIRDKVRAMNAIALESEASELGVARPPEKVAMLRLNEINAPALIIIGDLDQPDMVQAGEYLATNIRTTKKVVIAGTAHLPNMEQPDTFNRAVLDFLAAQ